MCPETWYWPRLSGNQQNQLEQLTMHRPTSTGEHIQHLNNSKLTCLMERNENENKNKCPFLGWEVTVASLHHHTSFLHLSRSCHCCRQSARSLLVPLWVLSRERIYISLFKMAKARVREQRIYISPLCSTLLNFCSKKRVSEHLTGQKNEQRAKEDLFKYAFARTTLW